MNQENIEYVETKWIENLALEELNMDESGIVHFNDHLSPRFALEESSIQFMDSLRDKIEFLIQHFNEYRGSSDSSSAIKIFKISNTVNDFMLFRSALRLIFSRKSDDLITISFLRGGLDLLAGKMRSINGENAYHEIRAHIGPFNKITWRFDGEEVDLDALVKHYLSEVIRNSAK